MLYWEDKRLGVFADLTYGQKVYQGWEDVVTPNGIKLSDNMNQVSPNAEKLEESWAKGSILQESHSPNLGDKND